MAGLGRSVVELALGWPGDFAGAGAICCTPVAAENGGSTIPTIADLLRDAATRTQVMVTTHSDILVDCFTATPEVVLVCEKRNGQTHIKRARPSKVVDEGLGVQWLRGRIGGKRW